MSVYVESYLRTSLSKACYLLYTQSVLFFIPSVSHPDVLCDPTDLIRRECTAFEAMTGHIAFIDGPLAEVFVSCKVNAKRSVQSSRYHLIVTLSLADRLTDVKLGATGLWLGTQTGVSGTATLA